MSVKKIRTFIFSEAASKVMVFCKRTIGLDLSLQLPGVDVVEVVSEKPISLPRNLASIYEPSKGFSTLPSPLSPEETARLQLLSAKIETLTILNTNVQLLMVVLNERFTSELAHSIPVSTESYPVLRKFLDEEHTLLISRCERELRELCETVMKLTSVEMVKKFYKDFSDHTIIGDYSASNKGML